MLLFGTITVPRISDPRSGKIICSESHTTFFLLVREVVKMERLPKNCFRQLRDQHYAMVQIFDDHTVDCRSAFNIFFEGVKGESVKDAQ